MNNDEMVLTIRIRRLSEVAKATDKDFFRLIKNCANVINNKRARNLEPFEGCPCKCPLNLSCSQCWARAIARFVYVENNIPVL